MYEAARPRRPRSSARPSPLAAPAVQDGFALGCHFRTSASTAASRSRLPPVRMRPTRCRAHRSCSRRSPRTDGGRRLDHDLEHFPDGAHRRDDRRFGHRDDVVDVTADGGERPVAERAAQAVGDRVRMRAVGMRSPAWNERDASSAPAGSEPMTRIPGFTPFAATAVPLISPPPPIGDTRVEIRRLVKQLERRPCPAPP